MKVFVTLLGILVGTALSSWGVIVISSEPNYQDYPVASFGPDTFLVVWDDWRNTQGQLIEDDVYAARVTLQGEVLEPHGIPIAVKKDVVELFGPQVWDGNNWFVNWGSEVSGGSNFRLRGARVSRDGLVLDPGGKLLLNDIGPQLNQDAAFDGQNFLLVWEAGYGRGIMGARITRDLNTLDPDGLLLWPGPCAAPRVAFDGQNYCVAWAYCADPNNQRVYAGRVRPDGVVLDTIPFDVFPNQAPWGTEGRYLAFGGGLYFVAVAKDTFAPGSGRWPNRIIGARITPQGVLLDSTAIMVSSLQPSGMNVFRGGANGPVRVAYNGQFFQAVWYCSSQGMDRVVEGARVEPSGRVRDTAQVRVVWEITGVQQHPGIAYGRDGNFLLVWCNQVPYVADLYGCFVDTSGRQVVGVEGLAPSGVSPRCELYQNVPNPFASGTGISYALSHEAETVLRVYNLAGQVVRTLFNGKVSAGCRKMAWDGRDEAGRLVPSGVYFYRLIAGGYSNTKKMVLIR
jgi:hypothetical protein